MSCVLDGRQERNNLYKELYSIGIKFYGRRYWQPYEVAFNAHDVVTSALLLFHNSLKKKKFESTEHQKAFFYLYLKNRYAFYCQKFSNWSLD